VIDVCLLGTGGMMPLPERPLSSLLLRIRGETILFDCGEGTQIAWRRSGWPFRPTGTILLSHLHADHVAGLPGVLFNIARRTYAPVTIYGPGAHHRGGEQSDVDRRLGSVRRARRRLRAANPSLSTRTFASIRSPPSLACHASGTRFLSPALPGSTSAGRGARVGRRLEAPPTRRERGGVRQSDVSGPARRGLKLALITDTRAFDEIAEFVRESDLLVCESMYADDADAVKAEERGHMTARQAARLARLAGVRRLWLTHFSPSITDPSTLAAPAAEGSARSSARPA
jgi:ribonuclease Z